MNDPLEPEDEDPSNEPYQHNLLLGGLLAFGLTGVVAVLDGHAFPTFQAISLSIAITMLIHRFAEKRKKKEPRDEHRGSDTDS
jgi:hypothetical protein